MKLAFRFNRIDIALFLGAFLLALLTGLPFNSTLSRVEYRTVAELPPVEITQGWQYRWGDLPIDDAGVPILDNQNAASSEWKPLKVPAKLTKPTGEKFIWFRVNLPAGDWKHPGVDIRGVASVLEIYLNNQLIRKLGEINQAGNIKATNDIWPIIPIEPDFAGKTLLFRSYVAEVPYVAIGKLTNVTVGSLSTLVNRLIRQNIIEFVLGFFFLIIGLSCLTIYTFNQKIKEYFAFGLLTLGNAILSLSGNFITYNFLLPYNPFISFVVQLVCFHSLPIGVCLFFERVFDDGGRFIVRRLWQVYLIFALTSLPFNIVNIHTVPRTVKLAYVGMILIILILFAKATKFAIKGNFEAKLMTAAFIVLGLFALFDILKNLDIIWMNFPVEMYSIGTLIFILILGIILERRFMETRKKMRLYFRELEDKNETLERVDKLKDEFLANTSHELRTPLNGIIGIAESMIDGATGKLTKQQVKNLATIVSSGKRLTNLVNDILDFAKLKNKNIELQIRPVDMRTIADVILTVCQPLIGQKNLQLINQIPVDIPAVDADENRVQQIMYNLIGNAIKFTDAGEVTVLAEVVNENLEITIADTGIGITADKLERIFESFEQADGSTARQYGGTGLGLAVTKKLVQLHGGEIRVESTVGNGSRFTFNLPISQTPIEETPEASLSLRDLPEISDIADEEIIDGQLIATGNGDFKILIVDDEPVNLQVLVNHLSLQNYAISQASNGLDALTAIENGFLPDLILLDVMMPKMTGYEVCEKIRERFPASQLPVVFLTANNQMSETMEWFGYGANDYLVKPISKNELLARIKTHIHLAKINTAYARFVPHEFLRFLEKETILDVKLGDQVQKEMTILFSDIRSFTTLSETMTPKDNFNFINSYLKRVGPVIRDHHGFIDKYIGDAVMALFPETAEDALQAAINMQKQVFLYNQHRHNSGYPPIAIGVGLHTGILMLGTIGEEQRMESTVISDAVNLASRMEGLTSLYGVGIAISEKTLFCLSQPEKYNIRFLGRVRVKGKTAPVAVFEVYDADPEPMLQLKTETRAEFEEAVYLYHQQKWVQAQVIFQDLLHRNEQDKAVKLYLDRCQQWQKYGISKDWEGIETLEEKS
ncbi:MAG TPA: ATP-binding protein [Leptolyngbyaceae cyanobacterium]